MEAATRNGSIGIDDAVVRAAAGESGLAARCAAGRERADMIAASGAKIIVATRPVDFRKGADGLAALAREKLNHNPFARTIFVFRSKRADRLKIFAWGGSGLVLLWKRLEHSAFR
ncbi:IS66 family insertion sequence element accessory protein TnpB [Bradyrhizobium sp. SEMIA]|uniref:IS66 family insertion sequence element accessory protein TnpB n=1 Tax=Bradyrhizobium sp. SEMIA TaxID=2597515 RepID=UPI00223F79D0|nr:IS66 family insertion sequence element accessory protein TnpB [Bradyrhizobium sp. SEMIA]